MARTATYASTTQRGKRQRPSRQGEKARNAQQDPNVFRCPWCPEYLPTPDRHDCVGTRTAERTMRKLRDGQL